MNKKIISIIFISLFIVFLFYNDYNESKKNTLIHTKLLLEGMKKAETQLSSLYDQPQNYVAMYDVINPTDRLYVFHLNMSVEYMNYTYRVNGFGQADPHSHFIFRFVPIPREYIGTPGGYFPASSISGTLTVRFECMKLPFYLSIDFKNVKVNYIRELGQIFQNN
jgi:hypothetical protein